MKKYVSSDFNKYLLESKTIPLKRKYGERPTIMASINGPVRNKVLSFVAESGSVSKRELKEFILGLKENRSNLAAANMFLKRNAKYFITENRNGITYYKLSDLGRRLFNRLTSIEDLNISESKRIPINEPKRKPLDVTLDDEDLEDRDFDLEDRDFDDEDLEDKDFDLEDRDFDDEDLEDRDFDLEDRDFDDEDLEDKDFDLEDYDFDDEDLEDRDFDLEDRDFDDEDLEDKDFDLEDRDFDDEDLEEYTEEKQEVETDQFEYEEDNDKIQLTYYKNPDAHEFEEDDELEESEEFDEDEDEFKFKKDIKRPKEPFRKYDFRDKGQPGIQDDLEESLNEKRLRSQFEIHKLSGKKRSKLGGKYKISDYHNLLDDDEYKDDNEIKNISVKSKMSGKLDENKKDDDKLMTAKEFENFIESLIKLDNVELAKQTLKELFEKHPEMNKHTGDGVGIKGYTDRYKKGLDLFREYLLKEMKPVDAFENKYERKKFLLKEAEEDEKVKEPSEEDELSDEDLDIDIDLDTKDIEDTEDKEVEEVEITEFIITVDDVDAAIKELEELGIKAERVPIEKPEEEVPVEIEEEPKEETEDKETIPTLKDKSPEEQNEVFRKFITNILNEAEDANKENSPKEDDVDLGSSDELNLGDQEEKAPELKDEEPVEYEENKIRVSAEYWDKLKPWLEEKGVDIEEMFGGEIETKELSDETEETEDNEIDFTGIGDDDDTKVEMD